ncbi:cysteine-rich protein 2-binding protein-like isoform X1 [Schistocerca gregaria]|uniref:cysteine-rich protein 2-binding protein-like isoform X1 n=1 Tax=Schistocerca gregaria TaxID=7010 RepID=UPI00211EA2B2|nr:cysteine-rich protein 2-binding protein-like isoform X1 [Schistocerca gregaria]
MRSCFKCANDKEPFLTCNVCRKNVHPNCLSAGRLPGSLLGDVFFDYTCSDCSFWKTEEFWRQKLSWINILILTLYNLQQRSGEVSLRGYFHWKVHICAFIHKHWDTLFGQHYLPRKKNWYGTVSGTLSHFSPEFFSSGSEELKEPGWWRLTHSLEPYFIMDIYLRKGKKRPNEEVSNAEQKTQKQACLSEDVLSHMSDESEKSDAYITEETSHNPREEIIFMSADNFSAEEVLDGDESKRSSFSDLKLEQTASDSYIIRIGAEDKQYSNEDSLEYLESMISANLDGEENIDLDFDFCFDKDGKEEQVDKCVAGSSKRKELMSEGESESGNEDEKSESEFIENEFKPLQSLFTVNRETCLRTRKDSGDHDSDIECSYNNLCENNSDGDDCSAYSDSSERNEGNFVCIEIVGHRECQERLKSESSSTVEQQILVPKSEPESGTDDDDYYEEEDLECNHELTVEEDVDSKEDHPIRRIKIKNEYPISQDSLTVREKTPKSQLRYMSPYDELVLLKRLHNIVQKKHDVPSHIYRYYRKLHVRKLKRDKNMPLFNLDHFLRTKEPEWSYERNTTFKKIPRDDEVRILDRYQVPSSNDSVCLSVEESFLVKLVGSSLLKPFYSPYTKRMIKPYIRQDWDSKPLWMKFLLELDEKTNRTNPSWQPLQLHPIDYCYVQREHVPVINALCHEYFYPGIDVSECLHYPEFTCVVLYKKLIVGFAIMVPDVSNIEAYISFIFTRPEWRKAGIATFMLYHLIQTSQEKDVTLHVSAKNSAMILYQKFGFKIEKFEYNFYERYLPFYSKECKHALFLRLEK